MERGWKMSEKKNNMRHYQRFKRFQPIRRIPFEDKKKINIPIHPTKKNGI